MRADSRLAGGVAIAVAAILCFAIHAGRAYAWAALGLFDQWNVLFDTDPSRYWATFAHGWSPPSPPPLVHSGLRAIGIAVRAITGPLAAAGLVTDPVSARSALALLVAPASAALSVVLIYVLGVVAGCRRAEAVVIAAAFGAMFASDIYFAMPESYPLAFPLLVGTFVMVAVEKREQRDLPLVWWFALSTLAAAVTITNAAAVAVAFVASRWARQGVGARPVLAAAATGTGSLAVCLLLAYGLDAAFGAQTAGAGQHLETAAWAGQFPAPDALPRLLGLASLPAQLAGIPEVIVRANEIGIRDNAKFRLSVTYEHAELTWQLWGLALAGLAVWASLLRAGLRAADSRPLALAGLLVLAMNAILHLLFGRELYLYGMHFTAALVAAVVSAQRARPMGFAKLGILAIAVVALGQYRLGAIEALIGA